MVAQWVTHAEDTTMLLLPRLLYLLGSAFVWLALFFLVQVKLVRRSSRKDAVAPAYRRSR